MESFGEGVLVKAVDADGYSISTLLQINEKGLTRYTSCDSHIGIALDERGRLLEEKDVIPDQFTYNDYDALRDQITRIFNAFNTSIGENKIQAIKITRILSPMGLKEAKDFIEENFF
jgi:hypothetical protein